MLVLIIVAMVTSTVTAQDTQAGASFTTETLFKSMCKQERNLSFSLPYSEISSVADTLLGVRFYYTDACQYEDKSVESSLADYSEIISVGSNATGTVEGDITLPADTAKCDQYTCLCAVLKMKTDSNPDNDDACVMLTEDPTDAPAENTDEPDDQDGDKCSANINIAGCTFLACMLVVIEWLY
ncbi:uncharacterized protein LOC100374131 [Saccoglossus kowalevskii]|uniref:Uncharacterized protein LOC100374131 n=1 Tax=Saccoglossus kowalevskii TaxID=10224 RepID=A0ABM0GTT8_SACKO|nr:PREDICTED: uncharacterized protein LOC100374131 [Saccoglossus kowalevskii]